MYAEHLQNLKVKLRRRVNRLEAINDNNQTFNFAIKQFWKFLNDQSIFVGILHDLELRYPQISGQVNYIFSNQKPVYFNREEEQVEAAHVLLGKCNGASADQSLESVLGRIYTGSNKTSERFEAFRLFIYPLIYYLEEHLDDQRVILELLRRYKHKCEWFQRERLFHIWQESIDHKTLDGEKKLKLDMFEYLHDQGLDLIIEPESISGKADFIASQNSKDPLIADAKIFNPDTGNDLTYLRSGFNQAYCYTWDYNEPFGYLIIFKTCQNDLKISLKLEKHSTPYVVHNNKTIFIITIDIYPHHASASKRGLLKPNLLTEDSLIQVINASNIK